MAGFPGRAAAGPHPPLLVSAAANGRVAELVPSMSPTITQWPAELHPIRGVPAAFITCVDDGTLSSWPCSHVPCASSTVYSAVPDCTVAAVTTTAQSEASGHETDELPPESVPCSAAALPQALPASLTTNGQPMK